MPSGRRATIPSLWARWGLGARHCSPVPSGSFTPRSIREHLQAWWRPRLTHFRPASPHTPPRPRPGARVAIPRGGWSPARPPRHPLLRVESGAHVPGLLRVSSSCGSTWSFRDMDPWFRHQSWGSLGDCPSVAVWALTAAPGVPKMPCELLPCPWPRGLEPSCAGGASPYACVGRGLGSPSSTQSWGLTLGGLPS